MEFAFVLMSLVGFLVLFFKVGGVVKNVVEFLDVLFSIVDVEAGSFISFFMMISLLAYISLAACRCLLMIWLR